MMALTPREPSGTPNSLESASAASDTSSTWRKSLVMPHNQLRFNLVDRVHRDADDDEKRCAAEIEAHSQSIQQPARKVSIDEVADERQGLKLDSGDHDLRNQRQDGQI